MKRWGPTSLLGDGNWSCQLLRACRGHCAVAGPPPRPWHARFPTGDGTSQACKLLWGPSPSPVPGRRCTALPGGSWSSESPVRVSHRRNVAAGWGRAQKEPGHRRARSNSHPAGTQGRAYRHRSQAAERRQAGRWAGWGGPRGCARGCRCPRGHPQSDCFQPVGRPVAHQGQTGPRCPPSPSLPSTHQASMPPTQWHDRPGKARGQRSVAGQQPVHIGRRAHGVAAEHMDGLIQVVLHLVLLGGDDTK